MLEKTNLSSNPGFFRGVVVHVLLLAFVVPLVYVTVQYSAVRMFFAFNIKTVAPLGSWL